MPHISPLGKSAPECAMAFRCATTKSCGNATTLDCRVYNLAALEILNPNFERLAKNLKMKDKPVEEKGPLPRT